MQDLNSVTGGFFVCVLGIAIISTWKQTKSWFKLVTGLFPHIETVDLQRNINTICSNEGLEASAETFQNWPE